MRELNRNNPYNYAVFFAFTVGVFLVDTVFAFTVGVFFAFAEIVSDDDALISFALLIGVIFGVEVVDSTWANVTR